MAAMTTMAGRRREAFAPLRSSMPGRSKAIGVADCAFPATFTLADILLPHFGRESRYGPKLQAWRETVYAYPVVRQVTGESRRATLEWMSAG